MAREIVYRGKVREFLKSLRPERTRVVTALDKATPVPGAVEEVAAIDAQEMKELEELQAQLEARGDSNLEVAPTGDSE